MTIGSRPREVKCGGIRGRYFAAAAGCGAAQFREVVAAGEKCFDVKSVARRSAGGPDQRDAHEPLAVLAEADPGRDRDIGALKQQLLKGERRPRNSCGIGAQANIVPCGAGMSQPA